MEKYSPGLYGGIRKLTDPIPTPPPECITLAVARHLTEGMGPETLEFHRERAQLIHSLVETIWIWKFEVGEPRTRRIHPTRSLM